LSGTRFVHGVTRKFSPALASTRGYLIMFQKLLCGEEF
jgi:hypothetical protein